MKKKILYTLTISFLLTFSSFAQLIEFERVIPPPPAPQLVADFIGVFSSSVAFSDVDNDGDLDVLITGQINSIHKRAKLYQNDGEGNYSEVFNMPFDGVSNSAIAFADVDGDGDQDVLITGLNPYNQKIAKLYQNDGIGNFSEVIGTPFEGVDIGSVAFSDVDGDGDQDLLLTGFNASNQRTAKLYQNDGNGNYSEVIGTSFEGVYDSSIAFSDVDGDGDQDVLITGRRTTNQRVAKLYQNDGSGNFSEVLGTPFLGVSNSSIAFSDIDGDGDQDLLITGRHSSVQRVTRLYQNDGNGIFNEVIGTPFIGVTESSIAFTDVDGDGDQDVLITGEYSSDLSIAILYENDGNGNFTEALEMPFDGVSESSIAFSDVDGDGFQDVLITGQNNSDEIISKLYINNSLGNYAEVIKPFIDTKYGSIATSDVDGDGDQDILITGFNLTYQPITKLYKNDGSGNFSEVIGTTFEGVVYSSLAFSDVDGDGDQDVLITGQNNLNQRIAKLYQNDGSGNFSEVLGTPFIGVIFSSVAFADVDGDGDQDLLITGFSNGVFSRLYLNDGIGNYAPMFGVPFIAVSYSSVAFADVDGDGDQDVLITGQTIMGEVVTRLYKNNGSGNFSVALATTIDDVYYSSVAFADVDGDGDQDLLITGIRASNQRIAKLYQNNGIGNFSEVAETPFVGIYNSSIAFSDVDNDGDQDVLISGGGLFPLTTISKLYQNDGNGNFTEVLETPFIGVWKSSLAFADFDGDGDKDILIMGENASGQGTTNVYRNQLISTVGITENSFKSSLKLYPNPTTGTFTIDMGSANKENMTILITYIQGRLVKELSFQNNQVIEISLQNEPVGMYLVEVVSGKEKAVFKLLKQ